MERALENLVGTRKLAVEGREIPSDAKGLMMHNHGMKDHRTGRTVEFWSLDMSPQMAQAQQVFRSLLENSIVLPEEWDEAPEQLREEFERIPDVMSMLDRLVEHYYLTEYQKATILNGKLSDLRIGPYRILEPLGQGGMGIVYQAEHLFLRRQVAMKVVQLNPQHDSRLLQRFYTEARAVSRIRHPNIVACFDAGEQIDLTRTNRTYYCVMELVSGRDLEALIREQGPISIAQACHVIHQIAEALAEAHRFGLVHRDIKPSNIMVTPEWEAKLLDFGLARQKFTRTTLPGTILGTISYMAPEQAQDSTTVDGRADLFGLGGTLYWCLTGQEPFEETGDLLQDIIRRARQPTPSLRAFRSDFPSELDNVLARMLASNPDDRFPTASAVAVTLLPFLRGEFHSPMLDPVNDCSEHFYHERQVTILLVDDELLCRQGYRAVLEEMCGDFYEAGDVQSAWEILSQQRVDLVILDYKMPGGDGVELLHRLSKFPVTNRPRVVMVSGNCVGDELAGTLQAGADDVLMKPFSATQLRTRVQAVLERKWAQDNVNAALNRLATEKEKLSEANRVNVVSLAETQLAFIKSLVNLLEASGIETPGYCDRIWTASRLLVQSARTLPDLTSVIDNEFITHFIDSAPLMDIGKLLVPQHVLMKPGKLDHDEREIMQSHSTLWADILSEQARQFQQPIESLSFAAQVVRHHHERFDGTGYPSKLAGIAIPLPARLASIISVYHALRSRRPFRPGFSHEKATRVITEESPGQFDPMLLQAFLKCERELEKVYRN